MYRFSSGCEWHGERDRERAPTVASESLRMCSSEASGGVNNFLGHSVQLRVSEPFLQIQPKVSLFSPPHGSWTNRLNLLLLKSVSGFFNLQIITLTQTWEGTFGWHQLFRIYRGFLCCLVRGHILWMFSDMLKKNIYFSISLSSAIHLIRDFK